MKLEPFGTRIGDAEAFGYKIVPDAPPGAELGHFLKKADRDVEEEGEPFKEFFRVHPARLAILGVLDGRGQCQPHRLGRSRPSLLHMLSDNRKRIPVRHMLGQIGCRVQQHPARSGQRQAIEHVIGDEMRNVIALVGCSGDIFPIYPALFGHHQHLRQHGERAWVVQADRNLVNRDVGQAKVHVLFGIENGPASAQDFWLYLITVDPPVNRITRNHTEGAGP